MLSGSRTHGLWKTATAYHYQRLPLNWIQLPVAGHRNQSSSPVGNWSWLTSFTGVAQATTTNGFANGGFETAGTTTAAASWLQAASGYTRSSDAHSGLFSAQLASAAFNAAVMLQNSIEQGGLPALTVGDTPTLSFWAKGNAGGTGNVLFALRYLDGVGNILANSNNQFFQGAINTSSWSQITYNLGAVPVGATAAFIEGRRDVCTPTT